MRGRKLTGVPVGAPGFRVDAGVFAVEILTAEKSTVEKRTAEKSTVEKRTAEKLTVEKRTAEKSAVKNDGGGKGWEKSR